jgi:hypothetical protein
LIIGICAQNLRGFIYDIDGLADLLHLSIYLKEEPLTDILVEV